MRIAMGALGQSTTSAAPLETSLPWYQQFIDEFVNPFGTDTTVLAQQAAPIGASVSSAASSLSGLGIIIGVGALAVLIAFMAGKR